MVLFDYLDDFFFIRIVNHCHENVSFAQHIVSRNT